MTDPELVCPHCNTAVYTTPAADSWDTADGQSYYYACPVHGAVDPVSRLDESSRDVLKPPDRDAP